MSQGATVRNFAIELADMDRDVYASLSLAVAQHRSESDAYLVARVLAYCLEQTEGIAFTRGLDEADDAAIEVRDLTGSLRCRVEVGTPAADRLHKARKAADDVAVYCHKRPGVWLDGLRGAKIHEKRSLRLYRLDPDLVDALAGALERRNDWSVSRTEGTLYVATADASFSGSVEALTAW